MGRHDNLADVALRAAEAGVAAITSTLHMAALEIGSKSATHDLVTTADRASEAAILSVIRRARPEDPILGEETGSDPGSSDTCWFIDPLDGTANFVYGRAGWAVSVGARSPTNP